MSWLGGGRCWQHGGDCNYQVCSLLKKKCTRKGHKGVAQWTSNGCRTLSMSDIAAQAGYNCGAPAFRVNISTVLTGCLSELFWGQSEMLLG